jgi:hypothetical protein
MLPIEQPILALIWPLRFEYLRGWQAALLFLILAVPIVLLGIRSLAGLGPVRRWVAVGARLLVLLLFVLIIGGVRWQRTNKNLEVIVLRDISESTAQVRQYPGKTLQESLDERLRKLSDPKDGKPLQDRMGVISFHSGALIDERLESGRLLLSGRDVRPQDTRRADHRLLDAGLVLNRVPGFLVCDGQARDVLGVSHVAETLDV